MMYFMKLQPAPFLSIKAGTKRVEMRLNDEKRKPIKAGDTIEFTNVETGEKLEVRVIDKQVFESFDALYERFDKIQLGYSPNEVANPSDMLAYYPQEEIKKHGVLAIIIE